jgi:hypothetical protein
MNRVLVNNIQTLFAKREAEERQAGLQQRVAIGLPVSSAVCPLSISPVNFRRMDCHYPRMDGTSPSIQALSCWRWQQSVEAIFLSTFVRISQNRLSALSERRADLDCKISLLVEHEVTRILQVTRAVAERMGIEFPADHEIKELEQDVEPSRVLDTLERESKLKQGFHPLKSQLVQTGTF